MRNSHVVIAIRWQQFIYSRKRIDKLFNSIIRPIDINTYTYNYAHCENSHVHRRRKHNQTVRHTRRWNHVDNSRLTVHDHHREHAVACTQLSTDRCVMHCSFQSNVFASSWLIGYTYSKNIRIECFSRWTFIGICFLSHSVSSGYGCSCAFCVFFLRFFLFRYDGDSSLFVRTNLCIVASFYMIKRTVLKIDIYQLNFGKPWNIIQI